MAHLKAQAQHVLLQLVRFDAARAMRRVGSILWEMEGHRAAEVVHNGCRVARVVGGAISGGA
jgi:hypothetical protein